MRNGIRCGMVAGLLGAALGVVVGTGLVSGCSGGKRMETVTMAEPVSGWDDVKNVTRAGEFTFAGQPSEASLDRFRGEGGAMVIDMRTHEGGDTPGFDEQAKVEGLGMKYVHIPVSSASFSTMDVKKFIVATRETEGPILLHCGSSNRVGGLWAAYLALEKGVPTEEAIAAGKAAGMKTPDVEEAARRVIGR